MSRRFGRNQKRKMRAEIADAEAIAGQAQATNAVLRDTNQRLRERLSYIDDAARRLEYTALLPAGAVNIGPGSPRQPWRLAPRAPCSLRFFPDDVSAVSDYDAAYHVVDMLSLSYAIDDRPEAFTQDVHFYVEGSGKFTGQWAYRVSESALMKGGMAPDVRKRFALEIAKNLLKAVDRGIDERRASRAA